MHPLLSALLVALAFGFQWVAGCVAASDDVEASDAAFLKETPPPDCSWIDASAACDRSGSPTTSCVELGLPEGTVSCEGDGRGNLCGLYSLDTSRCLGVGACGNGIVEEGEECDESAPPDLVCPVRLTPCQLCDACQWVPGRWCGDGEVGPGEVCESDDDLVDVTCVDWGFTGGAIRCSSCRVSTSECTSACGDGVLNPGEECDPGNGGVFRGSRPSCTRWGYDGGTVACGDYCRFDLAGCWHAGVDARDEEDVAEGEEDADDGSGADSDDAVDGSGAGGDAPSDGSGEAADTERPPRRADATQRCGVARGGGSPSWLALAAFALLLRRRRLRGR